MITGMEVANASLYDGATGAGEAVLMAQRVTKKTNAVLSGGLHPHYRDLVSTLMDQTDQPPVAATGDLNGPEDLSGMIADHNDWKGVVEGKGVFVRGAHGVSGVANKRYEYNYLDTL